MSTERPAPRGFLETHQNKHVMTFFGILLLLAFAATFFIPPPPDPETSGKSAYRPEYPHAFSLLRSRGVRMGLFISGLLLAVMTNIFFYAKPGTAYAVQYWWGGDHAVTSQGVKMNLFSRTIPVSFEIAFQDTLGQVEAKEGEIYYRHAQQWEFADAIQADISTSLVIGVNYHDEEKFLDMADRNRSEEKLVWARIVPVYDQALKNTAKLMDAQDYISGASSQFDFYLRDQLENGMYRTEEVYREETEAAIIGDSAIQRTVVTDRSLKQSTSRERAKRYIIRKGSDGQPLRDTTNSLKKYGLTIIQAAVTQINWEGSFDERLDKQKDQVAQTQLEKQEAEKEYYATLKAVQMGERKKTERQKELEKDQIEKTIAAETAAKVAFFNVQEEKNLLDAARLEAQRIEVTSLAEADKNRRMVSAGLTPQDRAKIDKEIAIGVAEAFAKMTPPSTVIVGGSGSGGNVTESLIQATMAKQLVGETKK